MIINIPLQIDEKNMEDVLQRDYEGKVMDEIRKQITNTLSSHSDRYYGDRVSDGMRVLIEDCISDFLKEHRDEIVKDAAKILADKIARSKKGKEILLGGLESAT